MIWKIRVMGEEIEGHVYVMSSFHILYEEACLVIEVFKIVQNCIAESYVGAFM